MGLRHRSIRMRIFLLVAIPILALMGLYAFAAATTTSAALDLAGPRSVKNNPGWQTGTLEARLDAARLLGVISLAARARQNLHALAQEEKKTNAARRVLGASVGPPATMNGAGPPERQAVTA